MLGALYAASTAGGSITSILFRIPGESSSAVTLFDGFPMAKRGEGGRALGLSMTASAIGGTFSALALMFTAPLLAKVALGFDMPEYFALCLFGMSAVTSLGGKSQLKGLLSLCIGLFVVTIGLSGVTGVDRFTFGIMHLRYGVNMVAIVVGLFGFSEFLRNTSKVVFKKKEQQVERTKTNLRVIKWLYDLFCSAPLWESSPVPGPPLLPFLPTMRQCGGPSIPKNLGLGSMRVLPLRNLPITRLAVGL
jgi:putative tricarboxylic transport membrane protein